MTIDYLDKIKEEAQKYFSHRRGHGFDHSKRVYDLAVNMAKEENADLDVIKVAALLHDIAREKEEEGKIKCHAEEGVKLAKEILINYNFPKNKLKNVLHCIEVHRYSKGLKPKTKEAKIIQDADRLDALGAIAIARVLLHSGNLGKPLYDPKIKPDKFYIGQNSKTAINHFYEKILKITPDTFNTKFARKLAKERYNFVKEYLERFKKEWEGSL